METTQNFGLQMPAGQFAHLSNLVRLRELGVSGTQFDDTCCSQLAAMSSLHSIK